MRGLSEEFLGDLKRADGLLNPILERVTHDDTLMLAIRDNYANIYYRGGNILKMEWAKGSYQTSFDTHYDPTGETIPALPVGIQSQADSTAWVKAFPLLKCIMDVYFHRHGKSEREFQQLVARENNRSSISNESEYFVSDIEYAVPRLCRLDMLGIRWLATDRKNGSRCRAALIEIKYGDGALSGDAGLLKHMRDIDALISDTHSFGSLLKTMESQFNQLDELGLLNFNHCTNGTKISLTADDKPEVIFILANHNPRSTKLSSILDEPELVTYCQTDRFDLRFFVSSFAGYGLQSACMLALPEFRALLKSRNAA